MGGSSHFCRNCCLGARCLWLLGSRLYGSAMQVIDEAVFLSRLTDLYDKNRSQGSVYLWMKRFQGRTAAVRKRRPQRQAEAAKGEEPRCLVRACSNKQKRKISTIIAAKDIVRFQLALGNVLRQQLDGLKRREKKDDKKKGQKPIKKDTGEKGG